MFCRIGRPVLCPKVAVLTALSFLIVAALGLLAAIASAEEHPSTDRKDASAAKEDESQPGEIGSSDIQRPRIALRGLSLLFDQLPSTNLEISPEGSIEVYRDQGDFTLQIGGPMSQNPLLDIQQCWSDLRSCHLIGLS